MPKKENIERLFDGIAPTYDRLNHILSFGTDRLWRKRAVRRIVDGREPLRILDVACGTGDLTLAIAKRLLRKCRPDRVRHTEETGPGNDAATTRDGGTADKSRNGNMGKVRRIPAGGCRVEGIDLSENMLAIGRKKVARAGLDDVVSMRQGDGESLPCETSGFDRAATAFGIRNFEHIMLGLQEMRRVLVPGGKAVILELSMPRKGLFSRLYKFYFLKILPLVGRLVSGDKASYEYLPASVLKFPSPEEFCAMMRGAGFRNVRHKALTFGVCRMYTGLK